MLYFCRWYCNDLKSYHLWEGQFKVSRLLVKCLTLFDCYTGKATSIANKEEKNILDKVIFVLICTTYNFKVAE